MLLKVAQLVAVGIGVLLLVFIELLDWQGRMEIIKKRWPSLWKVINNRPVRLLLLVLAIAFLVRDFKDAIAAAPAPQVRVVVPQPTISFNSGNSDKSESQVYISSIRYLRGYMPFNDPNASFRIAATMKNSGPALVSGKLFLRLVQGYPGRNSENGLFDAFMTSLPTGDSGGDLGSSQERERIADALPMSADDRKDMISGKRPVYLLAIIRYTERGQGYVSEGCKYWSGDQTGETANAMDCIGHNRIRRSLPTRANH